MKKIFFFLIILFSFGITTNLYALDFDVNEDKVYVSGETIGLKVETGVVVTKLYSIQQGEEILKPWEFSNIQVGDTINKINHVSIINADSLLGILKTYGTEELSVEILRDNKVITTSITPVYNDKTLSLGLFVKDNILGVGTLTFVTEDSLHFASLGHQISSKLDDVGGNIYKAEVTGIDKSSSGHAGSKYANISKNEMGEVTSNSLKGVYGNFNSSISNMDLLGIKTKEQVKKGKATILTCIDGKKIEEFDIKITSVSLKTENNLKGIKFEITDQELLSYTGGVIQGMSGSPILQDGKIIGAVTHVIINTPKQGYGVFIEHMLEELDYNIKK